MGNMVMKILLSKDNSVITDDKERMDFQRWITANWLPKYHNFSLKDNNRYFFEAMEDAWGVWLGAKGYIEIMDDQEL